MDKVKTNKTVCSDDCADFFANKTTESLNKKIDGHIYSCAGCLYWAAGPGGEESKSCNICPFNDKMTIQEYDKTVNCLKADFESSQPKCGNLYGIFVTPSPPPNPDGGEPHFGNINKLKIPSFRSSPRYTKHKPVMTKQNAFAFSGVY